MHNPESFPIIEIETKHEIEQLGTKEKYWVYLPEDSQRKLFKIGRPNTGEDWAEVAAYEVAKLIGLPTAKYEFARYKGSLGALSTSVVAMDEELIHGNELLAEILDNYPKGEYYQVKEYCLEDVVLIMSVFNQRFPQNNILLNFVGYIVFDCLIANQDRHHENWALILRKKQEFILSPSYDHAAGFGCREQDARMHERLTTKDKNFAIEAYCQRAKTPFYNKNSQKLSTLEACGLLGKLYPAELCFWLTRVVQIEQTKIVEIFNRLPNEFINNIQRTFAQRVLSGNLKRLCELKNEICKNE